MIMSDIKFFIERFDLPRALKDYEAFDDMERSDLSRLFEFLRTEKDVFDRKNTYGHITGSAFLFNHDLSKVLLTHHKKVDKWLQFGGHSDGDENTLRVAYKETMEESGIPDMSLASPGIFDIDIHLFQNKQQKEESHWHFDVRFAFKTNVTKFKVSEESYALEWFDREKFFRPFGNLGLNSRFIRKWEKLLKDQANNLY